MRMCFTFSKHLKAGRCYKWTQGVQWLKYNSEATEMLEQTPVSFANWGITCCLVSRDLVCSQLHMSSDVFGLLPGIFSDGNSSWFYPLPSGLFSGFPEPPHFQTSFSEVWHLWWELCHRLLRMPPSSRIPAFPVLCAISWVMLWGCHRDAQGMVLAPNRFLICFKRGEMNYIRA